MTHDRYAEELGILVESVDAERSRVRVPFRDGNSNPGGALHGGVAASVIDVASALVGRAGTGDQPALEHAVVDLSVAYLAAAVNEDVRGENLDDWAFSITAAWNFGIVRVAGLYERLQYDTPQGNLKRNFWGISGTGPLGPGTWYAFYGQANDGSGPATQRVGGLTGGGDSGSWQGSLSYTYPLSKRTITYVGWNSINNEANASYNFNINPYTTVPNIACGGGQVCPDTRGANLNGFVGGVVHFF
jgi:uncharacterized protein (TIGR00369 family)